MVSYPCPFCGAPAELEGGCSGCGRPPFPDAAEVVRLNGRTIELYAEVEAARTRYGAAVQRFNAVQSQRNMLAARVKAAVAAGSEMPPVAPSTAKFPAPGPVAGTPQGGTNEPAAGWASPQGTGAAAARALPGAGDAVAPVSGWPGGAQAAGRQPEAAPRTVQNLLFVFGGLLLGSAAIVFAAVAWASFGVLGRAAILGVVTLLTLAVPPVALRRGLRATAETFAALGVLLVLLDGYAAWYADLGGVARAAMPTTYSGLVFAATAAVAGGYAALTRLRAARLAAVVAVLPVLPLLALHRGFGATGWTLVFVCVAVLGVLIGRTVERLAWIAAGVAVLSALPPALHALATVDGVPAALRIGGVMALLAALVVVAGLAHEGTTQAGAGIAVGIVAMAGARLVAEVFPHQRYAAFAALALLLAAAATVVPQRVRRGARVGAIVVGAGFSAPYVYLAVLAAVQTAARALPAWRPPAAPAPPVLPYQLFDWQEPAGLALLGAALWLLLRHRAVPWTSAVLVAFAAPAAATAVNTSVVSIVDAVVLLVLIGAALRTDRMAAAAIPFVAAHLALVGLATPAATLVVYAVLGGLSTVVALRAADRGLGLPAAVVALLTLPVTAAAAFRLLRIGTAGSGPLPPALLGATAGLAAVTAAAFAMRERADNAGTIATATAGAAVTVAASVQSAQHGGTTWFGTYAAAALAATWLAARAFRHAPWPPAPSPAASPSTAPAADDDAKTNSEGAATPPADAAEPERKGASGPSDANGDAAGGAAEGKRLSHGAGGGEGARLVHAAPGVVPLLLAVVSLVPAVGEVLLRPLSWLGAIWSGAPGGVGVGSGGTGWWGTEHGAFGAGAAACTLAVLAGLLVAVARRVGADRWGFAAPPASLAVMLGCVALEAPWPTVPAVTLGAGLVTGLGAALRRPSLGVAVGAVTCWFGVVPGLAGLLATPAATLAGLSAIVAAAVLGGLAGRTVAARAIPWAVAGVGAGWLSFAAARAADLPLRAAAYWVLLAAALALAAGRLLRGRTLLPDPVPAPVTEMPTAGSALPGGDAADSGRTPLPEPTPAPVAGTPAPGPAVPGRGAAGSGRPVVVRGAWAAGFEGRLLESVAHGIAVVAVLLTTGYAGAAAGVVGLWGVALGLRALAGPARRVHTWLAIAAEVLAYELVLANEGVSLAEAYTVPVALAAVVAGWVVAGRDAAVPSWTAFGPGLLAGFVPSAALVVVSPGDPVRRLVLGAVAVAVLLAGARLRLRAPIVVGGAVLVLVALHEVALYWDELPRWAPLAVAGALLVGFAVTYERRLRDLARLRAAMGRMR
ncbi:SCO7613 C-terminal domain-containing membrane protein [Dactylosporangium darangshiense]